MLLEPLPQHSLDAADPRIHGNALRALATLVEGIPRGLRRDDHARGLRRDVGVAGNPEATTWPGFPAGGPKLPTGGAKAPIDGREPRGRGAGALQHVKCRV